MKKTIIILLFIISYFAYSTEKDSIMIISQDISLIKLQENIYIIKSYKTLEKWGKVDANGMLLVDKNDLVLINTPWDNNQTKVLCDYIEKKFKKKIKSLIVTHSHDDCMGGFKEILKRKIKSYTLDKTKNLAKKMGIEGFNITFTDSLNLDLNNFLLQIYYPGPGHTIDNTIVWLKNQKILYAGCLVKELSSSSLGNITEADLDAYPKTLENLINKYKNANLVIPGHGKWGGIELIEHTLDLSKELK